MPFGRHRRHSYHCCQPFSRTQYFKLFLYYWTYPHQTWHLGPRRDQRGTPCPAGVTFDSAVNQFQKLIFQVASILLGISAPNLAFRYWEERYSGRRKCHSYQCCQQILKIIISNSLYTIGQISTKIGILMLGEIRDVFRAPQVSRLTVLPTNF